MECDDDTPCGLLCIPLLASATEHFACIFWTSVSLLSRIHLDPFDCLVFWLLRFLSSLDIRDIKPLWDERFANIFPYFASSLLNWLLSLLHKKFLVWHRCICLVLFLLPVFWGLTLKITALTWKHVSPCFHLAVWWFQVSHSGFYFIMNWFLYRIRKGDAWGQAFTDCTEVSFLQTTCQ